MRPFRAGFYVEYCFAFSGVKIKNVFNIYKIIFYVLRHALAWRIKTNIAPALAINFLYWFAKGLNAKALIFTVDQPPR